MLRPSVEPLSLIDTVHAQPLVTGEADVDEVLRWHGRRVGPERGRDRVGRDSLDARHADGVEGAGPFATVAVAGGTHERRRGAGANLNAFMVADGLGRHEHVILEPVVTGADEGGLETLGYRQVQRARAPHPQRHDVGMARDDRHAKRP